MAAAAEGRKGVLEELRRGAEAQAEERARIDRDVEEVAVMDDVMNRRRSTKGRRSSLGSAPGRDGGATGKPSRRMSRRQSSNKDMGSPKPATAASTVSPRSPSPSRAQEQGHEQTGVVVVSPLVQREDGGEGEGGGTGAMPPQYQKLLTIGLSREQVRPTGMSVSPYMCRDMLVCTCMSGVRWCIRCRRMDSTRPAWVGNGATSPL